MKGQVLLITVFTLTFALFSIYMLLAPIKDKLFRIKDMENVYQAIANSEKGLEASLLFFFKGSDLSLNKTSSQTPDPDCGGLNLGLGGATCTQEIYSPEGTTWQKNEIFEDNVFILWTSTTTELEIISDGFSGNNKIIRTILIRPY